MPFKKILVPLDFSDCSINAFKVAIDLCKRTYASLTILHSYNDPIAYDGVEPGFYAEDLIKQAEAEVEKEFEALRHLHPELEALDCDFVSSPLGVATTVNQQVDEQKIDLVVMGTRGASGLKGALFGTHSYNVAKTVNCPLLAIPEEYTEPLDLDKVVLATDLHEDEDIEVYKPLKNFLTLYNSELHLLHIAEKPVMSDSRTDAAWQLEDYFKEIDHSFHFRFEEPLEDGLIDYVESKDIKLLTVLKRKYPFIDRLFHKSLSKKLSFHTKVPLLILHEL